MSKLERMKMVLNTLNGSRESTLVNVIAYWAVEYNLSDSEIEELYELAGI